MTSRATQTTELTWGWAFLLKVHLALITAMIGPAIAWCSWVTYETIVTREFRDSATKTDGRVDVNQSRLSKIETDVAVIKSAVGRIEVELMK